MEVGTIPPKNRNCPTPTGKKMISFLRCSSSNERKIEKSKKIGIVSGEYFQLYNSGIFYAQPLRAFFYFSKRLKSHFYRLPADPMHTHDGFQLFLITIGTKNFYLIFNFNRVKLHIEPS